MPSSKDPVINRQKAREWRLANPDRHREANLAWERMKRATDPEWAERKRAQVRERVAALSPEKKAERAAKTKEWFAEHPGYNREKMSERGAREPVREMVWAAKTRAARLGVPFDVDWRLIEMPAVCPALGTPLRKRKKGEPRRGAPSLDRLIPSLGYVQSNVRVISQEANTIKHDKTPAEMRAYVEHLRERLEKAEAVLAYLERELAA